MLNSRDDVRNKIVTLIDKEVSDVDPDFKDELEIGDIYYGNIIEDNSHNNAEKAIDEINAFKNILELDNITTKYQGFFGASQVIVNYELENYSKISSSDVTDPCNMANMIDRIRCEHMLHNAMNKLGFDIDTDLSDDNVQALIKAL